MHRYNRFIIKYYVLAALFLALSACSGTTTNTVDQPSELAEVVDQPTPPDNSLEPQPEAEKYADVDFSSEIIYPSHENLNCPNWKPGQTILISDSQTLPQNCSFQRVTLQFIRPNIDFDCNGAVFNGLDGQTRTPLNTSYSEDQKPHDFGFLISDHESSSTRLSDITIRNCQLINYVNSVFIVMGLAPDTQDALRAGQQNEQSLRNIAPTRIALRDSRLINSHHHGIFVHRYVTNFELENTDIKGSGNSGLYLEAGSRYSNIFDSTFEGNGYSTYSTTKGSRGPRKSQNSRREGIAIDGTRYNTIHNNQFVANADGGVYLYKNCWEDAENPATLPRTEGANNNLIDGNRFVKEHVGVWLAERADRNLANFSCGDHLIHENDDEKYYRDFASENTISNNRFESVNIGIRVHDSDNKIANNIFMETANGTDIEIGSLIRNIIEDPVGNTTLENNQASQPGAILYR